MTSVLDRAASGPLAGIRVLDLTQVMAGPYCTQMLADMGADVIKIESPEGDITRFIGVSRHSGMSAQYLSFNRNKRSVVLDLKQPAAREALLRIASRSHVFVSSMRTEAMEALRIRAADIQGVNQAVVYCRIVGYGKENPQHRRRAYDDVIQAQGGLAALQQLITGEPGYVPLAMADLITGLVAANGILGALYRQAATGKGEELEVPMLDAVASVVLTNHIYGAIFDPPIGPAVMPRNVSKGRRPYRTADAVICVIPYDDAQWRAFFDVIGRPELMKDERFATIPERGRNLHLLAPLVEAELMKRPANEWLAILERHDIPASRVSTTDDLLNDESFAASGFIEVADHPTEGRIRLVHGPVRFTHAKRGMQRLPRNLGEDSLEVLEWAGLTSAEIDQLLASGGTATA